VILWDGRGYANHAHFPCQHKLGSSRPGLVIQGRQGADASLRDRRGDPNGQGHSPSRGHARGVPLGSPCSRRLRSFVLIAPVEQHASRGQRKPENEYHHRQDRNAPIDREGRSHALPRRVNPKHPTKRTKRRTQTFRPPTFDSETSGLPSPRNRIINRTCSAT
jgi:hypothetical protein